MNTPKLLIDQLEEALEERQGDDRRKQNRGGDPLLGKDRRQRQRRKTGQANKYMH
ncbi:hypothetical protein [Agaribacterium haliotis]|uniref:hypothetical protein n=1 Tax=Agaribacterium haliotis TaxID=2013869 RepID=UPI00186421F0|nr:hypothetical protein [Agaribacterium haliotis]